MDKPLYVNEVDPVCGMTLNLVGTVETSTFEGKTYGFCSKACKETFEGNPKKYIENPVARKSMSEPMESPRSRLHPSRCRRLRSLPYKVEASQDSPE